MITFNNLFISNWNKRIVYAPNGFGKTTNSIKLYEYLLSLGNTPLLFTRKRIENLVENYGNVIYFGETATNAKDNERINKVYAECNSIKQFFKEHYSTYAVNKLGQISLFFATSGIKKLNVFGDIALLNFGDRYFYSFDDAIKYDKLLDPIIYYRVKELLDNKDGIKKQKAYKTIMLVEEEILDYLDELKLFVERSETNKCPLCGKRFSSKEKLLEAIEKRRKKYKALDDDNTYNLLCSTSETIYKLFEDNDFGENGLYFEEEQLSSIRGMLTILASYLSFCNKVISSISYYFGTIEIQPGITIKDEQKRFINNQSKIKNEKTNIKNVNSFTSFIIKEIKSIVYVDSNLDFLPIPGKLEISVFKDGEPVDRIYDFLSESEIKRFSLVVLRALIKYGQYDSLILDDPIDSYDDYYMLVACKYITSVVNEKKLTNWFILTNNFTALSNLSQILKCDSVIYYYVPDDIFTNNDFKIDCFVSNYQEIGIVSKNELLLLKEFLKCNLNVDQNLAYVSFIVTLRNFKSLVLANYDQLLIKKGSKIRGTRGGVVQYNVDTAFNNDVKTIVEHFYMHYDPNPGTSGIASGIDSNTVEVNRIIGLYNRICKAKPSLLSIYSSDTTSLCSLRETIAKSSFASFVGSKILDLVLLKICIVSYLKYEFEKLLIEKLLYKYYFSNSDIQLVINSQSLGKKLDTAKSVSKSNLYGAEAFLKDYSDVFEGNKLLFNLFDHGLEQMFPPYIATNVKDIKRFKLGLDELASKY